MLAACLGEYVQKEGSCEAGVWAECDLPEVVEDLLLSAQAF